MNIIFDNYDAQIVFVPYIDSGNTAIQIIDRNTNRPIAMATTNVGIKVPKNRVILKTWSENKKTVEILIKAKVIKPKPTDEFNIGHQTVYVYELTERANKSRLKQYNDNQFDTILKWNMEEIPWQWI